MKGNPMTVLLKYSAYKRLESTFTLGLYNPQDRLCLFELQAYSHQPEC